MGKLARALFLLLGIGLLAVVVTQIDLPRVKAYLHEMGWAFPLIFLPYIVVYLCDTVGWRLVFGPSLAVPFHTLFFTRMSGEAINNITPLAYLGGEPLKAYMLTRFQIPMVRGMAASIIAKLLISIAQLLFVILGGVLAMSYLAARPDILWPLMVVVIGGGLFLAGLSYGLKAGLFSLIYRLLDRWQLTPSFLERWREHLDQIDDTIVRFYQHYPFRLLSSLGIHFVGWMIGTFEVFAIFYAVDLPISFAQALAIEALASVVKGLAFFIPGGLGAQEGGNVLIFALFGFSSSLGFTFSLVRRVRELLWIMLGLLVILHHYGWRSHPA
jgi:glycosyltransferase 2 family protein